MPIGFVHSPHLVVSRLPLAELRRFKGIGQAKAISIMAALEMARRRAGEDQPLPDKIKGSQSAYAYLHPRMAELAHEEFWILYLNNANKIIHCAQLSKGGITATTVDVRLVFQRALDLLSDLADPVHQVDP